MTELCGDQWDTPGAFFNYRWHACHTLEEN